MDILVPSVSSPILYCPRCSIFSFSFLFYREKVASIGEVTIIFVGIETRYNRIEHVDTYVIPQHIGRIVDCDSHFPHFSAVPVNTK